MNELEVLDGTDWRDRLDNREHWWDRQNRCWDIEKMTPLHRANVRRWLRKHARAIMTAVWVDSVSHEDEGRSDAFLDKDPLVLMRETEVYRALVRADTDSQ